MTEHQFWESKVLDFCFDMLLPAVMQFRRLEVNENYQRGQLGGCLTISRLSLKNTHTTANTLKSKTKTFKFWKDSLACFTVEQQHSKL